MITFVFILKPVIGLCAGAILVGYAVDWLDRRYPEWFDRHF